MSIIYYIIMLRWITPTKLTTQVSVVNNVYPGVKKRGPDVLHRVLLTVDQM